MFPKPVERSSAPVRTLYKVSLPVTLFIWLVPLLAIVATSIRPAEDINSATCSAGHRTSC